MPKAQVQAVIDLGDDWDTTGEVHMIACIEAGSATASRLFASCIAAQLEKKVETEMLAGVSKLLKLRPHMVLASSGRMWTPFAAKC